MCGITGVVGPRDRGISPALVSRMAAALTHRGPDDEGFYLDTPGVALAHRRLSIIDLEGGHQPLPAADGQVQIVANGEIYNYVALREDLRQLGFQFDTNSDCEVLAHGWVAWGRDLFARLEGMYAIAIWDDRTEELILARDRLGQKPMYYGLVGQAKDTLLFGSELAALVQHPMFSRNVSSAALAHYLTYECLPEDMSIYGGANKLQPGTFLVFQRASARMEFGTYWQTQFASSPAAPDVAGKSETELQAMLRDHLCEAVDKRLVADVPLGVLLSGGIDSSAIAAAMVRSKSGADIETFSIAFEDKSFDESSHARLVAEHLGTRHHEERLSPEAMVDLLPDVTRNLSEPLGDGSLIPTYLLSRFTRRHVKVALGGDGGDELFLGYPTFQADAVARRLGSLSLGVQKRIGAGLNRAAGLLPVSTKNFSLDFKIKRFAQGLGYSPDHRHQAWMGSFMPNELEKMLSPAIRQSALQADPYALIARLAEATDARDHFDRAVYQYTRLYLIAGVLVKVDRASMAQSLEVRAPFLDHKLVEFANAVSGDLKLHGLTTKYLLKQAVRPWLPNEIIDRPKKGFGMPIGQWLRGPLRDLAHDLLHPQKIRRDGFFSPDEVKRLLQEHDEGLADHRKPLWTLLAFQMWLDGFGPGTEVGDEPSASAAAWQGVG